MNEERLTLALGSADTYSVTMQTLTQEVVLKALAATGKRLLALGEDEPVEVVVCGAVAGILSGDLSGKRQTYDCDVISSGPGDRFTSIAHAAADVAGKFDLKPEWLNRDASIYAHLLPLGWRDRLTELDTFGPLQVMIVSRRDLLALKLISAEKRPYDLQDIDEIQPTADELDFLADHVNRLEAESLDRRTYDRERDLINDLRKRL